MTMTPIHRIPVLNDGVSLADAVRGELDNRDALSLADALRDAVSHDESENGLSVMLDWAMQVRMEFGISWSESIDYAMIAYYG